MRLEWTPELAVGVELIDAQHQELIAAANALLSALNQGQGREAIATTLRFLEEYILLHFEAEEKLMVKHAYAGYPRHKQAHADFIRDFVALKRELVTRGASPSLAMRLHRCIAGWLPGHIATEDAALAGLVRGAQARPGAGPRV
jgi:hemerythrin